MPMSSNFWQICLKIFNMQKLDYSDLQWHIMSNGTDTFDCGTPELPCKTLDWVLERFHNTSFPDASRKLSLITDSNLTIDSGILVSLPFSIPFICFFYNICKIILIGEKCFTVLFFLSMSKI